MTSRPWPEGTRPTATQLLEWLTTPEDDPNPTTATTDRLTVLDQLLADADTAARCTISDHDRTLADHHRATVDLLLEANRYRLAWRNARNRAAYYRRLLTPALTDPAAAVARTNGETDV